MNKKLQVFVSSTYTDLIEERQAAVQAILDAGHIPAGMELFKAGNESQLKTIYKWIDESDVYMLILGGRYGSIESKSGKSYTQLEYEYAISKNIPVFAVVLSESFLTNKVNTLGLTNTMEQKAPDKYQSFKVFVMSKIVREVDDCKDIKIAIHTTLSEFLHEKTLAGWIRNSNENDILQLSKDNNTLNKKITSLNKQIQKLQEQLSAKSKEQFGNRSLNELIDILQNKEFTIPKDLDNPDEEDVHTVTALKVFISFYNDFCAGIPSYALYTVENNYLFYNICPYFLGFNILKKTLIDNKQSYEIGEIGTKLYVELELNNYVNDTNPFTFTF